jgi:uncharacterized protein (TIGR00255 family)
MSLPETGPVYSMTGFASLRVDAPEHTSFTLTLKSVNHRFLDLQMRVPQNSETLEAQVRKAIKAQVHRGHVEFSCQLERQSRAGISFNEDQAAAYIEAFRALAKAHALSCEPDLNDVLRLPGMMSSQQASTREETDGLEMAVLGALPGLLDAFNAARADEGKALAAELRAAIERVATFAEEVGRLREGARRASFERLRTRIAELTQASNLADDRLLAEAALLADRSDIEEELVRLRSHAESFVSLLEQGGQLGKRLDFLLQELNREANTLLSKTGGTSSEDGLRITELGLEMKVEIERAREQIQNIE